MTELDDETIVAAIRECHSRGHAYVKVGKVMRVLDEDTAYRRRVVGRRLSAWAETDALEAWTEPGKSTDSVYRIRDLDALDVGDDDQPDADAVAAAGGAD